jgi:glycosyltransferase involved in cell wall biosynthesis
MSGMQHATRMCPTLNDLPSPPDHKTGWPWTVSTPQLPALQENGQAWPSFLIVMPSYNQGQFIEEGIRTILLQGYPRIRFVIIDGGSTDNTVEILKRYEPWLSYWVSESDRGQSHALNKGFAGRSADICAYLNSDDYYLPGVFKLVAESFLRHDWDVFMGRHEPLPLTLLARLRRSNWQAQLLPIRAPFLIHSPHYDVHQESTFWKGCRTVGMQFDEQLHMILDADWFCRISRGASILMSTRQIGHVREHPARKTAMFQGPQREELHRVALRWRMNDDEKLAAHQILNRFNIIRWRYVLEYKVLGATELMYRHPSCQEYAPCPDGSLK